MAQITRVTSEALQATIRRLLPSQQGFGEDLEATNVITPVIDLTPTAEGSLLTNDLARALSFDSQTFFSARNATTALAASPGFWRIFGTSSIEQDSSSLINAEFTMTDGASSKTVWRMSNTQGSAGNVMSVQFDFIVYLNAGESISAVSSNTNAIVCGSYRQIATVTGETVNPAGFVSQ